MKLKNKEGKKLLILFVVIILVTCAISTVILQKQKQRNQEIVNQAMERILETIQEKYPEVEEAEIIHLLNQTDFSGTKNILKRYGMQEEFAIQELENQETKRTMYLVGMVACMGLVFLGCFVWYLKYRQKKLDTLTTYLKQLEKKDYSLAIEENSEDELNQLKNELYKITVMLKEQAEESQMQRNALAVSVSDISHQLKTPLTSIQIMLDNLRETENMDFETRKHFLLEASSQIQGMNWLIIALLKLSKLDAGAVTFKEERIGLRALLEDILANLEVLIEIKEVEISLQGDDQISIIGDYNWNKEAIQNILKNAIEHTPSGKKIWVTIEENIAYRKISIQDEGEGISKEDQKHIFDRFYKAENASEESIGIGLALSKTILEKQNGYIAVESEKGKGTTFSIRYTR